MAGLHGSSGGSRDVWASQGVAEFLALSRKGVCISLDGKRVTAPPGVIDSQGFMDLTDKSG